IANASESYKLEVRANEENTITGKYRAQITDLRPPTPKDYSRVAAERSYADGDRLDHEGKVESRRAAIGKLEESLALWREVGDPLWEATSLFYIGYISYELGEPQRALEYYTQALPLWRGVSDEEEKSMTLSNIGRVYDAFGDYQKALDYYNLAL